MFFLAGYVYGGFFYLAFDSKTEKSMAEVQVIKAYNGFCHQTPGFPSHLLPCAAPVMNLSDFYQMWNLSYF